ncbi:hypothetical protein FSP39_025186, partial [Pinctada imbricata]
VLLTLLEKQVEFTRRVINLGAGENTQPWFIKINPLGVVPVLKDGDNVVCDSEVIIDYIEQNIESGNKLIPEISTPEFQAADKLRKMIHGVNYQTISFGLAVHPSLSVTGSRFAGGMGPEAFKMSINRQKEELRTKMKDNPDMKDDYQAKLGVKEELEQRLSDVNKVKAALNLCDDVMNEAETALKKYKDDGIKDSWLVGQDFTVADVVFTILLHRSEILGLSARFYPEEKKPYLYDYVQRLMARPSVKKMLDIEGGVA